MKSPSILRLYLSKKPDRVGVPFPRAPPSERVIAVCLKMFVESGIERVRQESHSTTPLGLLPSEKIENKKIEAMGDCVLPRDSLHSGQGVLCGQDLLQTELWSKVGYESLRGGVS